MRRKVSPQPFIRGPEARPLSAAVTASRLPTAAALAIALASLAGCASRGEEVTADPVAANASPIATEPAPSASAPGMNSIDPEPHPLPGEPAIVAPVVSATAKPKPVPIVAPSIKPRRTAGVPMHVKLGPHDPDF